jgi:hypothetical protein
MMGSLERHTLTCACGGGPGGAAYPCCPCAGGAPAGYKKRSVTAPSDEVREKKTHRAERPRRRRVRGRRLATTRGRWVFPASRRTAREVAALVRLLLLPLRILILLLPPRAVEAAECGFRVSGGEARAAQDGAGRAGAAPSCDAEECEDCEEDCDACHGRR